MLAASEMAASEINCVTLHRGALFVRDSFPLQLPAERNLVNVSSADELQLASVFKLPKFTCSPHINK